jgi:hypothetical protein
VVLVDLTFANGGDLSLGQTLLERGLWGRLYGYSAWNTLGNRLGSGLANLALPVPDPKRFLLERVGDDLLYQADFRWRAAELLGHPGLKLEAAEELRVRQEIFPAMFSELEPYRQQIAPAVELRAQLPWHRLFELQLR